MNCPKCNTPNPDGQKFCGNCGAELPQNKPNYSYTDNNFQSAKNDDGRKIKPPVYKRTWFLVLMCIFLPPIGIIFTWVAKRPKNLILRIILTIILALYTISGFSGLSDSDDSTKATTNKEASQEASQDTTKDSSDKNNQDDLSQTEPQEPTLSPEEYKAQCQELNYNDVMRNPDQYKGQKFKITVQIYTASEKISSGRYFKTFTDDGSGAYFDKLVWVIDKRDDKADSYVKLLEGDTVTFYGEFDGLQKSKNAISDEKTEDLALNAYYADIVKEAE